MIQITYALKCILNITQILHLIEQLFLPIKKMIQNDIHSRLFPNIYK